MEEGSGKEAKKGAGVPRRFVGVLIVCAAVGIALTNLLGDPFGKRAARVVSREGVVDMAAAPAASWEVVEAAPHASDLGALAFAPGGYEGAAVSVDGALMVTHDGGLSWEPGHAPEYEGASFNGLQVYDDRRIALGAGVEETAVTLLYETDGAGAAKDYTWKAQRFEDLGGVAASSGAGGEGALMVGGGGLVLRRTGGGWLPQKIGGFEEATLFCAARSRGGSLALAGGDAGVIARSSDGGATWRVVNRERSKLAGFYGAAITDAGAGLLAGARGQFFRTDTAGETWAPVRGLTAGVTIHSVVMDDAGEGFAAGGDVSGDMPVMLHTSDGGLTWRPEAVRGVHGNISAVGRSATGIFSVTADGKILKRRPL